MAKMKLLVDGVEIPKEEISVDTEAGGPGVFLLSTTDYEFKLPMWLLHRNYETNIKTPTHRLKFVPI
jgi:hypothetical protein